MALISDKGSKAEELLLDYFLDSGFFAVRAIPVLYEGIDITDVDIWLYLRPSPISRERVSVDAKNRSTPKALERILWAKGLQTILGLERCIVATTDKRPAVKKYGVQHDVLVLDGSFLSRLANRKNGYGRDRYSEEEFVELLGSGRDDKLLGNWRGRINAARGQLLTHLEFDGCNSWLADASYFIEQSSISARQETACRLVYLVTAYLLIGLDFSMRTLAFEEVEVRRKALEEGFRYGSRGRGRTEDALSLASQLIATYAPESKALGSKLRSELLREFQKMPVEILSEFFSKNENAKELFNLARTLEARAYSRAFVSPGNCEPQIQSVFGVLLDFFSVDRRNFLK